MAKKYKFINPGTTTGGKGYTPTRGQTQSISEVNQLARQGVDIRNWTPGQLSIYENMGGDWITTDYGSGGCSNAVTDAFETVAPIFSGGALLNRDVSNQASSNLQQVGENIQDIDPLEGIGFLTGGGAGALLGDLVTDEAQNMQDAESRRLAGEAQADANLEDDIADETQETIDQVDDEAKRRRDFLRGLNPTGAQGLKSAGGRRRMLIGF